MNEVIKCRFLSEEGICKIGSLTFDAKQQHDSNNSIVPNLATIISENSEAGFSQRQITKLSLVCTVANNLLEQKECDTFVPDMGWVNLREIWAHFKP